VGGVWYKDDQGVKPRHAANKRRHGVIDGQENIQKFARAGLVLDGQLNLRQAADLQNIERAIPVPVRQRQAKRRRDNHQGGGIAEDVLLGGCSLDRETDTIRRI